MKTTGAVSQTYGIASTNSYLAGSGMVLLDNSYTFDMVIANQNLTSIYVEMTFYWI